MERHFLHVDFFVFSFLQFRVCCLGCCFLGVEEEEEEEEVGVGVEQKTRPKKQTVFRLSLH